MHIYLSVYKTGNAIDSVGCTAVKNKIREQYNKTAEWLDTTVPIDDMLNHVESVVGGLCETETRGYIRADLIRQIVHAKFDDFLDELRKIPSSEDRENFLHQFVTEITEDIIILLSSAGLCHDSEPSNADEV